MSTLLGLIAFASFVCAVIGLFKPSLLSRFSKRPMTRKRSLSIFGSVFFVALILSAATSPTNPATDSQVVADDVTKTESITYVTEEGSPEREIEKIIVDLLGDTSNEDVSRIRNIDALGDVTLIEYNADANLTSGMTRRSIWSDVIDIIKKLSADPAAESITVNAYIKLVDQYGNEDQGKVMTVNLSKETWSKINWDNFNTENLPNVADFYYIHPAINN
jgi:hypothetical protein